MKTAIITGASSGLGRELARQIEDVFPEIECYWLIARRGARLESLSISLPGRHTTCLALDLCDPMSFIALQERLAAEKPEASDETAALPQVLAPVGVWGKVAKQEDGSLLLTSGDPDASNPEIVIHLTDETWYVDGVTGLPLDAEKIKAEARSAVERLYG